MDTKRVYLNTEQPDPVMLDEAGKLLREGKLVAFPTETVYGLGANALDADACAEIFRVKGRPQDNPLIVHVNGKTMADRLVSSWTRAAEICADAFWPGALTLVLPKDESVPDAVTGGLDTVALRMPSHPVALALIGAAGVPLAAPSANLSGKPSPTSGRHVWQDLQGKIPMLLDAGSSNIGLESTVLDVSGEIPMILRPGGVSLEQLEEVLGKVQVEKPSEKSPPKAPGMKYRHYAPKGEMYLVLGSQDNVLQRMEEEIRKAHTRLKKVGVLCTLESASYLNKTLPELLFVLGSKQSPNEVASSLFEGLRRCDDQEMDVIIAEGIEIGGLGMAVMNRLEKASGGKIIIV